MIEVEEKLRQLFPKGEWKINKSAAGESNQAFTADNGHEKVFIKYDVKTPALGRLAELGITAPVIYDGTKEDRPYVIQEFVEGTYPDRTWFANNLEPLAEFIKKYQQDEELKELLSVGRALSYTEFIEKELTFLDESIKDSQIDVFESEEIRAGINSLKEKSRALKPVSLVPTHADPNSKNFLLTDKGLMMVDWDDISISDPMRDVGLMLWWYVPKGKWPTFFDFYGQAVDEEKVYWWTARCSIQIATWFAKKGDRENAQFFIRDFLLALHGQDNSQMHITNPNE